MSETNTEKLAYSIDETIKILPIGKTKLYEEIKKGRMRASKFGARTLIPAEAIKEWLSALPSIEGQ